MFKHRQTLINNPSKNYNDPLISINNNVVSYNGGYKITDLLIDSKENIHGGNLPTLLLPGKVIIKPWMSSADKQIIETQSGIKFVMQWLRPMIPEKRNMPLSKPPKKPGEKYLVFKSGTGSGKSTALPTEIFRTFFEGINKNIGMTEPRVFNCIDIVFTV
jgi:hypothetical protein